MRSRVTRLIYVSMLAILMWSPARLHAAASLTAVDYPGAFTTFAQAINNSGVIVGGYVLRDGTEQGFVYSAGQYSNFTVPGSKATVVTGINDNGVLAGYYSDQALIFHSFVYDGQNFTYLDFPGAMAGTTIAGQINNAGVAVGNYMGSDGVSHGFTYTNGTFTGVDVPGAKATYVYAIDSAGEVAGGYITASGTSMPGFILAGKNYRTVNFPGAANTSIRGLNDNRQFAGVISGAGGGTGGFTYLGKYQATVVAGSSFTAAYGINNAGQVVGYYVDKHTSLGHGFLQTP
jgi:hypothetical protein